MPSWKLGLFVRVYERRLKEGETMQTIDESYPKLTENEKEEIHQNLKLELEKE